LTSKHAATVSSGLASKHATTVFSGLASKSVATVFSSLASKLVATVSPDLTSKPTVGFLVEPQNQCGGGIPGLGLKIGSSDLSLKIITMVILVCASKSSGLRFVGFVTKLTEGGQRGTHIKI
jgi:hypothetical protein